MEKILGILPTTDGTIYADVCGYIHERIGIAYVADEEYDCVNTKFICTQGYIDDLPDNDPYDSILGKKGDTVTLRDLSVAFSCSEDPRCVVKEAEQFFTVVKDNLPDTVVLSFDTSVMGKYNARMEVKTKEFPWLGDIYYDLSEEDYKIKDGCEDSQPLAKQLIPVLHAYADIIGKRPNLEIYIEKEDNTLLTEDELESSRKRIAYEEEMFLPRLRRFINEKLDEAMAKDAKAAKELKDWKERREAIRKASLTKYDLDPNLY